MRGFFGTATIIAFLAMPASAQITADDLWNSHAAVMTALGATPTGTLSRDGRVVTLTGAGGSWAIPMGHGQITWRLGDVTLTEQDDGSVLTTFGDGLDLSFDVTLASFPELSLGGQARIAATGLDMRSEGTPDAITTTTRATTLSVDLVDLRTPDTGSDMQATGFLQLDGVERVATVTHDGKITIDSRSHVDRMVTDGGVTIAGMGSRDVGEYRDISSTVTTSLPAFPIDPLDLGPALRNGLSVRIDSTSGAIRSQSVTRGHDGNILSDDRQTVGGATQAFWLNGQDGVVFHIDGSDIGYKSMQNWLGSSELGATLDSMGFDLRLPLLAGQGRQTAQVGFRFEGLRLGPELFGLLDLPGDAFDRPGAFAISLRADFEPTVDLTDVMALDTLLNQGESPATVYSIALENLTAGWDGAELAGTGSLGWDRDGEPLTEYMQPPQGQATFDMIGAYAVLDRLSQTGALPPEALLAARGALAGFGRPVGADHLRSIVELGPDGVRVNGAPVPF